ncbi:MAG: pitrilysin family protein [Polyangiaceae bacterium]
MPIQHTGTIPFGPTMKVESYALANGLRLLVEVDPSAPVVCLQTWVRVGSRFEREGKTGICHLFEHLMFGETELSGPGVFDRTLEEAGVETNAATFLDWTYYHQNLPKEALALSIRLESERLTRLVLREPQVASEKEVVSNERRQRVDDDIDGFVSELLYKTAFERHGYGIPTIGWMKDIQAFTPEDCVAFYKTYYAPNNVTLVVVGDVELPALLDLVERHYGGFDASVIPPEVERPEPPQIAERRVSVEKPTETFKVAVGYKSPAFGDPDHAPMSVLSEILFGGRGSRVHRALVRTKEIASEVRGYVGTFKHPSLFDIWLSAREPHDSAALLAALDEELDRVVREPVSAAELEKAKARIELGTLQGLESVSGKAETIGLYDTVLGTPASLFDKLEEQRRVTIEDVARVAKTYLRREGRTVVEVEPSGELEEDEDGEGDEEEAA